MNFLTSKFFMMVLPSILKSLSPALVSTLQLSIVQLKETAKATPNPWDDILVIFLEDIVTNITAEVK